MNFSNLAEVLNLVSPGEPELWPTVNKNDERLLDVSGLNIVKLHTVDCHVLVLAILRVQQAGGWAWSRLNMEHGPTSLVKPHHVSKKEHRNGNDKANDDRQYSCPFYHLRTHLLTGDCTDCLSALLLCWLIKASYLMCTLLPVSLQ